MKLAFFPLPLLKKPTLCPDDLNNFRPVSLLSFLSKLVERVVCRRLATHLFKCNLSVPVQSALLKVVNDLLISMDNGDAAVPALLDPKRCVRHH